MIEMFGAPLLLMNFHLLFSLLLLAVAVVVGVLRFIRWLAAPPTWRGVDDNDSPAESFFDGLWRRRRDNRWW